MDTEKMFELADRLRALRDEKAEADQRVKRRILPAPEPCSA